MSDDQQVKLFLTEEHQCSYLKDRQAQTLFVDPSFNVDELVYGELNALGFRRSGAHFYRPHCKACRSCLATRVLTGEFKPNRSQRRTSQKNSDLSLAFMHRIENVGEHYQLYARYINERHANGDMYPPSEDQFRQFIVEGCFATRFLEFRLGERLIAVLVMDQLADGLSAIYTYFEPSESERSLGVFAILSAIQIAGEKNLPFVCLGYFIAGCEKMEYKANYRPLQMFVDQRWTMVG